MFEYKKQLFVFFIMCVVIFLVGLIFIIESRNKYKNDAEFEKVRCDPEIKYLLKWIRPDVSATENNQYCEDINLKEKIEDVKVSFTNRMDTIENQLRSSADIQEKLKLDVMKSHISARSMVSSILNKINLFQSNISDMADKTFAFNQKASRIAGWSIYTLLYLKASLIGTGRMLNNLTNAFCFHPDTLIHCSDQTYKISEIYVGDRIAHHRVTGTLYMTSYTPFPMVKYQNVIVEKHHVVQTPYGWLQAQDAVALFDPSSQQQQQQQSTPALEPCYEVYCLFTNTHQFKVDSRLDVLDFWSDTSEDRIKSSYLKHMSISFDDLHPRHILRSSHIVPSVINPDTPIKCMHKGVIPIKKVCVGDLVQQSYNSWSIVNGLVTHIAKNIIHFSRRGKQNTVTVTPWTLFLNTDLNQIQPVGISIFSSFNYQVNSVPEQPFVGLITESGLFMTENGIIFSDHRACKNTIQDELEIRNRLINKVSKNI